MLLRLITGPGGERPPLPDFMLDRFLGAIFPVARVEPDGCHVNDGTNWHFVPVHFWEVFTGEQRFPDPSGPAIFAFPLMLHRPPLNLFPPAKAVPGLPEGVALPLLDRESMNRFDALHSEIERTMQQARLDFNAAVEARITEALTQIGTPDDWARWKAEGRLTCLRATGEVTSYFFQGWQRDSHLILAHTELRFERPAFVYRITPVWPGGPPPADDIDPPAHGD